MHFIQFWSDSTLYELIPTLLSRYHAVWSRSSTKLQNGIWTGDVDHCCNIWWMICVNTGPATELDQIGPVSIQCCPKKSNKQHEQIIRHVLFCFFFVILSLWTPSRLVTDLIICSAPCRAGATTVSPPPLLNLHPYASHKPDSLFFPPNCKFHLLFVKPWFFLTR